ncbi:glycosyltransferase family 4 protein [Haloarcula marina]|uniref:glycosyltransferase family 4 protein n=1 Tax=Haloarcula marina TaxID=2961574 RepID=UPI0020B6A985|nr:glycosyltransferase family 4 protein [Halomicroarcula marina]
MAHIALIRGPYLRPDGVRPWEYLHNETDHRVVAFESDPPRFDTDSLSMPVEQLPWPDGWLNLFGYDHFISRAVRKLRFPSDYMVGLGDLIERFDVLHTSENFNLFSAQAARATRGTDTAFAFSTGENIPYPLYQRNPLLWKTKQYVNRRAAGITTTTPLGRRALIHEGVPHEKVTVLPNAIDTERFAPVEDARPADVSLPTELNSTRNVLFVHGLCEQKGTYDLLSAFERIENEDARLVLLGTDELDDEASARIAKSERIVWRERIPYTQMPTLYNLADVAVLPSVTMPNNEEQFGMAVLEAMACGTATVVTDVGGLPYVVSEGESSLVVPERSPLDLARAIENLLCDEVRRTELGNNGRHRAYERYRPAVVGEQLREFYDDLTHE